MHTYTLPCQAESSLGLFITSGLAEEGGGERNGLLNADKSNTEIVVECLWVEFKLPGFLCVASRRAWSSFCLEITSFGPATSSLLSVSPSLSAWIEVCQSDWECGLGTEIMHWQCHTLWPRDGACLPSRAHRGSATQLLPLLVHSGPCNSSCSSFLSYLQWLSSRVPTLSLRILS